MTVLETPKIILGTFTGLSTDIKPTFTGGGLPVNIGTIFVETDTGRTYRFDGLNWIEQSPTGESANFNALQPRSSFIQLFGDTFAQNSVTSLYLLEDVTGTGADLTNNGGIDLERIETDLPLRGFKVPSLNGTSQYFSTADAVALQVGTGSFVASIRFRVETLGTNQVLFSYGNSVGGGTNWLIRVNPDGTLQARISEGGNTLDANLSAIYSDNEYHTATMIWDKDASTNGTLFMISELEQTSTESGVAVGSLNDTAGLRIGAWLNNVTVQNFVLGELSNFHLYKLADYNIPALVNAGLRESAGNISTTLTVGALSTARMTNRFFFNDGATDLQYTTTVINVSEGFYDLIDIYQTGTSGGISEIYIDGNLIVTTDQFNGSTVLNNSKTTTGIFLSGGTHILKVRTNGTSATLFNNIHQWLTLVKRDGIDQGDDECSSGVLFGDELRQRSNNSTWALQIRSTSVYNSRLLLSTGQSVGDFTEGTLFLKRGLYKMTATYQEGTNSSEVSVFFNGVEAFAIDQNDAGGAENVQDTRLVFLEGGETNVRIVLTSVAGGSVTIFNSIRFELVDGKTNEAETEISYPDNDFQIVSGVDFTLNLTTTRRFNGQRRQTTDALNDEILYSRYFSGGTYAVDWLFVKAVSRGIIDVFWDVDTNLIFDDLDQFDPSTVDNQQAFATVTIPRGFHNIHFRVVGQNGSSTGHKFSIQRFLFTKIGTVVDAVNDDNSDGTAGALVPLAHYVSPQGEQDVTLNFGGIDRSKFSEIKVLFSGEQTGQPSNIRTQINGVVGTAYYTQGTKSEGTASVIAVDEKATSSIQLVLIENAGTGVPFLAELTVQFIGSSTTEIGGKVNNKSSITSAVDAHWLNTGMTDPDKLTSLRIFTTIDWLAGATIDVYGVLR